MYIFLQFFAGISRTSKGSNLEALPVIDIASEFDGFVRELFDIEPPLGVRLPASHRSMYGYFVDMDSGNFTPWDALIPATKSLIERGTVSFGDFASGGKSSQSDSDLVPTVDTVRYSFLASLLLTNKVPVLVTGDSGTGKSAILKDMLVRLGKDDGASLKQKTILGSVLNYTDKNQAMLANINTLTKGDQPEEEGSCLS